MAKQPIKKAPPDGIMLTMKTGHCQAGWCERRKVAHRDWMEEKPVPRCKGRYVSSMGVHKITYCPCDCHDDVTELYDMANLPRVWPDSVYQTPKDRELARQVRDTYVFEPVQTVMVVKLPENHDHKAVTVTAEEALNSAGVGDIPKRLVPPNPAIHKQDRQVRGRAPGQLELEVKLVCDGLILGIAATDDTELRPVVISRLIDADNPPSTGAVTNILRAWRDIGFAVIEEGPVRFVGYTVAGIELGIDPLRKRYQAEHAGRRRKAVLQKREDNRSGGLVGAIERRRAKGK